MRYIVHKGRLPWEFIGVRRHIYIPGNRISLLLRGWVGVNHTGWDLELVSFLLFFLILPDHFFLGAWRFLERLGLFDLEISCGKTIFIRKFFLFLLRRIIVHLCHNLRSSIIGDLQLWDLLQLFFVLRFGVGFQGAPTIVLLQCVRGQLALSRAELVVNWVQLLLLRGLDESQRRTLSLQDQVKDLVKAAVLVALSLCKLR